MIADALLDGETGGEIRLAQVVEEDAADTARLLAMLEIEYWFIVIFTVIFYQPKLISNLPQ